MIIIFHEHYLPNNTVETKTKRFIQKFATSSLREWSMFYFFLNILFYMLLPSLLYIGVLCDSGWGSWLPVIDNIENATVE